MPTAPTRLPRPVHSMFRGLAPVVVLAWCLLAAHGRAQFVADFSSSPPSGTNTFEVDFTGIIAGGTAFTWQWDFGDGFAVSLNQPEVSHTYTAPGSYTVSVTAIGLEDGRGLTLDEEVKVDYVTVSPALLQAAFSTSATQGTTLHTVDFTDTSTGPVTARLWDFGDGTTSIEPNPSHTYMAPGTYDVSLTAFVGQQSDTALQTDLVTIDPAALVAGFEASTTSGVQPLTVAFTDTTAADTITGWLWDFGDGSTSTEQHPVHVYEVATATTFTVSLTAFVGEQQDVSVQTDLVSVDPAPLLAAFDTAATISFGSFEVSFSDLSQGGVITDWLWDFGDGSTSTEQHPVHTYAPVAETTQHDVSLTVSIGPQDEVALRAGYITLDPTYTPIPVAPLGAHLGDQDSADIDGDGDQDLLVAAWPIGRSEVSWLENTDGQGTFGPPQLIWESVTGTGVVLEPVDVDGDGDPDLVLQGPNSALADPSWLENVDGTGSFAAPLALLAPFPNYTSWQLVDLGGTPAPDILYLESPGGRIGWVENDGSGAFGPPQDLTAAIPDLAGVWAGDVDDDGDADLLAFIDQTLGWYEDTDGALTLGPFTPIATVGASQGTAVPTLVDLDGDGDDDLLAETSVWLGWYENLDGAGSFGPRQLVTSNFVGAHATLDDVDLDGDPDLLASPGLRWYENVDGLGSFGPYETLAVSPNPASAPLVTADVDGDGDHEIITRYSTSGTVLLLENRIGFDTWADLGQGLPGAAGVPHLEASGELAGGETVSLSLRRALPGASAWFILGLSPLNAPFKGGVLIPSLDILLAGLPVDPTGRLAFDIPWPSGLPGSAPIYLQFWIVDPAAPAGFSASNGLQGTTKP